MTKEQEVRKQVKTLQRFYKHVMNYVFFNALFTAIWYLFDSEGPFWPKYVMFIWGISLAIKAYRLEILPFLSRHATFLTPEWEDQKVRELMHKDKKESAPTKVPLKRDVDKKDKK